MLTSELRSKFLDYFKKNRHEVVDSSPLIPANDETLLFTEIQTSIVKELENEIYEIKLIESS